MEARCNQQYSCGQDCCSDVICAVWNELLLEGKEMIAEPKPAQLSVVVDAETQRAAITKSGLKTYGLLAAARHWTLPLRTPSGTLRDYLTPEAQAFAV